MSLACVTLNHKQWVTGLRHMPVCLPVWYTRSSHTVVWRRQWHFSTFTKLRKQWNRYTPGVISMQKQHRWFRNLKTTINCPNKRLIHNLKQHSKTEVMSKNFWHNNSNWNLPATESANTKFLNHWSNFNHRSILSRINQAH